MTDHTGIVQKCENGTVYTVEGNSGDTLRECEAKSAVVGPSVIRIKFKLGRGQALQGLASHLEDVYKRQLFLTPYGMRGFC